MIADLHVNFNDDLWSVSPSMRNAVGISKDFIRYRQKPFEYIEFLWNVYVLYQEEGRVVICYL
jgi:hypothetical protein